MDLMPSGDFAGWGRVHAEPRRRGGCWRPRPESKSERCTPCPAEAGAWYARASVARLDIFPKAERGASCPAVRGGEALPIHDVQQQAPDRSGAEISIEHIANKANIDSCST